MAIEYLKPLRYCCNSPKQNGICLPSGFEWRKVVNSPQILAGLASLIFADNSLNLRDEVSGNQWLIGFRVREAINTYAFHVLPFLDRREGQWAVRIGLVGILCVLFVLFIHRKRQA